MYEHMTPEYIKKEALSKCQNQKLLNLSEGSFCDDVLSGAAYMVSQCYGAIDKALCTLLLETSDEDFIVKSCKERGVYRKEGAKAVGTIIFSGTDGYVVPKDFGGYKGELRFVITEDTIITDGTCEAPAEACEVGKAYNIDSGNIISIERNLAGISGAVSGKFDGGVDVESIENLKKRYFQKLHNPPLSGNAAHYEQWAMEVDGVAKAKAYPAWNGGGTVKVVVANENNQAVSEIIIERVIEHITSNAPPTDLTVVSAHEKEMNISANCVFEDITKEALETEIINILLEYFLNFRGTVVYASKLSQLIMEKGNVADCVILVNGASSVAIETEEFPILGTVTVTEA